MRQLRNRFHHRRDQVDRFPQENKVKETTTVELSKNDVEWAVKRYLQKQGYEVKSLYFKMDQEDMDGDWDSSMPTVTVMNGAKATVTKV